MFAVSSIHHVDDLEQCQITNLDVLVKRSSGQRIEALCESVLSEYYPLSAMEDFTFNPVVASIYRPIEVGKHATYVALEPGVITQLVTPWNPNQLMTMSGSYYKVLENPVDSSKFYGVVDTVFEATHTLKRGEKHGVGVWVRTARVRAVQATAADAGKVVKTIHGSIVETETALTESDWIVEQFESPANELMVLKNDNFTARFIPIE